MLLRKLASQTAIYGISSIAARLLNYLLTPYLTRIMSPGEYGVITDIYALIPFLLILLTMGLETGYFRFAGKAEGEAAKGRVFATAWGTVIFVALLFMGAVGLFNGPIAEAMAYATTPSYIWIMGAIVALDAITALPFAKLREENRPGRFVLVRVVSVVINVALCLFFYSVLPKLAAQGTFTALYDPLYGAGYVFVANLIASAVTLLILFPSFRGIVPRVDPKILKPLLLYSLPLLVSGIAGTANEFIDRQMIKYLMPADMAMSALGIYGAVVKIGVVLILFTQMYRLAAEPFFLANFKRDEFTRINAEAMKYFIIVSVFIFLLITLFVDLFALIVGADFREGMYILPVVLLSNICAGIVLNLSFWYKQTGRTIFAIVVTGTGLLFTVWLNLTLVPRLGYYGAALARLGCEVAMVGLSYYLNRRFFPTPYDLRRIGGYLLAGAACYGVSLLTLSWPPVLRYGVALGLLSLFVCTVIRCEQLNVGALFRSTFHRN